MPKKARFGFGSSSAVEQALSDGKINARDIVFLDENTENPKVGWVTKDGEIVVAKPDLSGIEADISQVESELATKANAEEVNAKIDQMAIDTKTYTDGKVEAAVKEHLVKKYEISDAPDGTLVDYRDDEIRIMCKNDSVFTKQSVGVGGDPNCYYVTLKTYVFNDDIVGYKEHLDGQSDSEILTDLKEDEFGHRYQPTWLALAKYDEATGVWNYYGKNSTSEKFVGWDYRIDFYDTNGVMIASDSIRINLSNEDCHFIKEPYYVGKIMKDIDTIVEEKIAEVEAAYEVIEF